MRAIEWNAEGDSSLDGRWLIQCTRIREGRKCSREYQLLDLHRPVPGTGGLMHESFGMIDTPAQGRAMAQAYVDAEANPTPFRAALSDPTTRTGGGEDGK